MTGSHVSFIPVTPFPKQLLLLQRMPIFSIVGRETGEVRFFVRDLSDAATWLEVVRSTVPAEASVLYTDDWGG
jgi:hypothetical protein